MEVIWKTYFKENKTLKYFCWVSIFLCVFCYKFVFTCVIGCSKIQKQIVSPFSASPYTSKTSGLCHGVAEALDVICVKTE